jgi:hypothetical protein
MVSHARILEHRGLGRHIHAGSGVRPVGVRGIRAVFCALGLDDRRDLHAERNAFTLARPVGDRFQGCCVGLFDLGFLCGVKLGQNLPGGCGCRCLRGGTWQGRHRGDHAGIAVLYRIDGIRHCDMHHGEIAQPRIVAHVVGCHNGVGSLVPVGDDIGVYGEGRQRDNDYAWQRSCCRRS